MAIFALPQKPNVPAQADFLLYPAQVGTQFVIGHNTQLAVFKIGAQAEGKFILHWPSESDRLDLPGETLRRALGQLHPHAGRVNAGALQSWQLQEAIKL